VAVAAEGRGEIGAHPLAAGVAERVDALHGETGQILHVDSLRGRELRIAEPLAADPDVRVQSKEGRDRKMAASNFVRDAREQCE
jgi:hypothetical protein